ncbi:MAG: flagellin lysine-N-methylase [Sphaerochaetaceae bacterium]|nr:flagellin lysine-N-methylase [Spirochaetales bacterium]MDY5500435.1 flagellin lysine-N-methylase [Sphaerochaetaceae bacterium]
MRIAYPSVFTGFSCLAGDCPLTCCIGWSVEIDSDSLKRYQKLAGKEGEVVRSHLVKDEDAYSFTVTPEGHCWFLDRDGLCRMQKELGADALCETCRYFPRISWNVGCYLQFSMDLACPEACRMAFTRPLSFLGEEQEGGTPLRREGKKELAEILDRRGRLIAVLQRPSTVRRIVTDGREDTHLASIVADCTRKSRVGFLTPARIRQLHRGSDSYWQGHEAQLEPWFTTLGSLLLFRYGCMAWYGMPWGRIVRFVRRAMRMTYLLLLHQQRDTEVLDVDAMVAASVLFARRIEHVEQNMHLMIAK